MSNEMRLVPADGSDGLVVIVLPMSVDRFVGVTKHLADNGWEFEHIVHESGPRIPPSEPGDRE